MCWSIPPPHSADTRSHLASCKPAKDNESLFVLVRMLTKTFGIHLLLAKRAIVGEQYLTGGALGDNPK